VYLTDRGKAIRQELWPVAIEGRKRVYKGLTENDLAELRRILGVIDRNLTGA
jgi:DNA-binding MarR family transcriptional regulator